MPPIRRLPAFVDDLTEGYAWLADRNRQAADRFLGATEAAIALLGEYPELGRRRDDLRAQVRSFVLRRFGHILFYRIDADGLTLLRLLHGARDASQDLPIRGQLFD